MVWCCWLVRSFVSTDRWDEPDAMAEDWLTTMTMMIMMTMKSSQEELIETSLLFKTPDAVSFAGEPDPLNPAPLVSDISAVVLCCVCLKLLPTTLSSAYQIERLGRKR